MQENKNTEVNGMKKLSGWMFFLVMVAVALPVYTLSALALDKGETFDITIINEEERDSDWSIPSHDIEITTHGISDVPINFYMGYNSNGKPYPWNTPFPNPGEEIQFGVQIHNPERLPIGQLWMEISFDPDVLEWNPPLHQQQNPTFNGGRISRGQMGAAPQSLSCTFSESGANVYLSWTENITATVVTLIYINLRVKSDAQPEQGFSAVGIRVSSMGTAEWDRWYVEGSDYATFGSGITVTPPYRVTVNSIGTGSSGSGYYNRGTHVAICAGEMHGGFIFSIWQRNTFSVGHIPDINSPQTTFQLGADDAVLTAHWRADVTIISEGATGFWSSGGHPHGGFTINVFAGRRPGYAFSHWTVVSGGPLPNFSWDSTGSGVLLFPGRPITLRAHWERSFVTGITSEDASQPISHDGGTRQITVTGGNFVQENMRIAAFLNGGDGSALYTQTSSGDASGASAILSFPENRSAENRIYTIRVSIDGGITWSAPATTVMVNAPPNNVLATLSRDGSLWNNHNRSFTLRENGITVREGSSHGGTITFRNVANGIYNIFDGEIDTGRTVAVHNSSPLPIELKYFTVEFRVDPSSRGTIKATSDGVDISSGDAVLYGKELMLAAIADDTIPDARFAWRVNGTPSGFNSTYTITVDRKIYVICTVLGGKFGPNDIFSFRDYTDDFVNDPYQTYAITGEFRNHLLKIPFIDTPLAFQSSPTYRELLVEEMNTPWRGSSFGMSAVMSLVEADRLTPSFFQADAQTLSELKSPVKCQEVWNLINYYQLMRLTPETFLARHFNDFSLRNLVHVINSSDFPVIIGLDVKDLNGFPLGERTVVAHGITKTDSGYSIAIWDPRYVDTHSDTLTICNDYMQASFSGNNQDASIKYFLRVEDGGFDNGQINIQELLTRSRNISGAQSFSSILPSSAVSPTDKTILITNFASFQIMYSGGGFATIQNGRRTSGNINIGVGDAINEVGSDLSIRFLLPNLSDGRSYTVMPLCDGNASNYTARLLHDNERGYYSRASSDELSMFVIGADGSIRATSFAVNPAPVSVASTRNNYSSINPLFQAFSYNNGTNSVYHTVSASGIGTELRITYNSSGNPVVFSDSAKVDITLSNFYNSVTFKDVNASGDITIVVNSNSASLIDDKGNELETRSIVTVNSIGAEYIGGGNYRAGDIVNIFAGIRQGYTFCHWSVSPDVSIHNENERFTSFTMPDTSVSLTAIWKPYDEIIRGDVNRDGDTDLEDIALLTRFLLATDRTAFIAANPTFSYTNADVNGDGEITATDLTLLLLMIEQK
jgi:hypothetical protein